MLGRLYDQTLVFSVLAALVFCFSAVVFSTLWLRSFPTGPLETVMRHWTR
jgi:uncharacterized membrane protein YeiB